MISKNNHEPARTYLDEIERDGLPTRLIGFTGGEPFVNPDFPAMIEEASRAASRR